jgi:hypothetical protein
MIFCPILTSFGFPRQIFLIIPHIKLHGNQYYESRADTSGEMDELQPVTISFEKIVIMEI